MQDRRIFKRFKVDIPVKFLVVEENKEGTGRIVNISAAGVGLVITLKKMQLSSHLEMRLELPRAKDPYHIYGQVVWLRQVQADLYKVGVEFDKVDFMGMSKVLRVKGVLRDTAH